MLYPQNGDRIVTIDSVTSLRPMYMQQLTATVTSVCSASYVRWRGTAHIHPPHAAAAERLATIDRSPLPGPRWDIQTDSQTNRRTNGRTGRRTDARQMHRLCSVYYAAVPVETVTIKKLSRITRLLTKCYTDISFRQRYWTETFAEIW